MEAGAFLNGIRLPEGEIKRGERRKNIYIKVRAC
jgi:hypothetical protein